MSQKIRRTSRKAPARTAVADYARRSGEPMAAHIGLVGLFAAGSAALAILARRKSPAARIPWSEILLLGIATHKVARIVAKDRVMGPLRSPFVEYQGASGSGEVEEQARGEGLQKAVGQLVTCPYCMAPWVASVMSTLYLLSRPIAQIFTRIFTAVTIADVIQKGYARLKESD